MSRYVVALGFLGAWNGVAPTAKTTTGVASGLTVDGVDDTTNATPEQMVQSSTAGWKSRHVALADRNIDQWNTTRRLNNVFGCHSLGWSTDKLQCAFLSSSSSSKTLRHTVWGMAIRYGAKACSYRLECALRLNLVQLSSECTVDW